MIDVVNRRNQFLSLLFATSAWDEVIEELKKRDVVSK